MTALTRLAPLTVTRERLFGGLLALAVTGTAFGLGLAFAGRPLIAALAAAGLLALIVCLARPHAATYIVIAILYSNAAAVAVRQHGLPDIVGLAFPLLLALPLADHLLLKRKPVTITAALPFLFGLLVVQILSALTARDPSNTFSFVIIFVISGFGLYFVVTNVIRSYTSLRYAVWTVLLVAAGLGALSSFQAITSTYANDYWGFSTVNLPGRQDELVASLTGTPRHEGPLGEINRYGQIMLVLLPIGALVAFGEQRRTLRALAVVLTILILCGMASSFSRGAFIGLVAVLAVGVLFRYVKVVHIALLVVALAVVLVAFPRYGERLINLQAVTRLDRTQGGGPVQGDTGNLRGRLTSSLAAVLVWADYPVVGVGPGQFRYYYVEYSRAVADAGIDTRVSEGSTRQAHNLFSSVAAETGTLGFALFMAVFLVTMRDLNRARRRWLLRNPQLAHLAAGFFLALVGYLASGMFLHLAYERYLWFLLALAGVAAHLALKGLEDDDLQEEGDLARKGISPAPQPSPT